MDNISFSAPDTPASSSSLILVVEDDTDLRQTIMWMLEDEGQEVEGAGDGKEAVERALRRRPTLVLLDMGLPLLDGNGVAAHLRSTYGDTVLIVTMTADGRASEKAKRIGAVGCLSKPFELDDLLTIVRETLSNR